MCPFESGNCGNKGKKLQKLKYLKNEELFRSNKKNFS